MSKFAIIYLDASRQDTLDILGAAYAQIVREGLLPKLFYDGANKHLDDFAAQMTGKGTLPFVVLHHDGEYAAFAWLNCIEGKTARAHYCVFRKFWGKTRILGNKFFRYILAIKDDNGHLFNCVYGITPGNNPLAWRAAQKSGWKVIGRLPGFITFPDGETVDGVITAATRRIIGITDKTKAEYIFEV